MLLVNYIPNVIYVHKRNFYVYYRKNEEICPQSHVNFLKAFQSMTFYGTIYIRAGEFRKKIYAPGPKVGFWSKKCPQKAGESYAQFSPSSIWEIGLYPIHKDTGTLRWSHRTQRIWIYVKVAYNFLIFHF